MRNNRRAEQPEPQRDPLPDDHAAYRPGYRGARPQGNAGVYDPWPLPAERHDDICHMTDTRTGIECGRQKRWRTGGHHNAGAYLCPACDLMELTPDESLQGRSHRPYRARPFAECSTDVKDNSKPRNCRHCNDAGRNIA